MQRFGSYGLQTRSDHFLIADQTWKKNLCCWPELSANLDLGKGFWYFTDVSQTITVVTSLGLARFSNQTMETLETQSILDDYGINVNYFVS